MPQPDESASTGRSKRAFRARHAFNARVELYSMIERLRQSLEDRLCHVVHVASVEHLDMQIHPGVIGKGAQEFLNQREREITIDRREILGSPVAEKRTATDIHYDADERFVHGHIGVPVAANSTLVSESPGECLAERNASVLDRMMEIHLDVAVRLNLQITQAMPREEE